MRPDIRPGWLLLALAWLAGCARQAGEQVLLLERFDQLGARVFLNEELTLHFSRPLDPASVHGGTFKIRAESGQRVPGEVEVSGRRLTFRPRLPQQADLLDGGLTPGGRYQVELEGFPRLGNLRSREGWPLQRSLEFEFACVSAADEQALFLDASFAPPAPLELQSLTVGQLEPLRLRSTEALDPRRLNPEAFALFALDDPSEEDRRGAPRRIALRLELLENRRNGALLELVPIEPMEGGARRVLEPGQYLLVAREGSAGVEALGGQRVLPAFGTSALDGARIEVTADRSLTEQGGPRGSLWEDFLEADLAVPRLLVDADGSAQWTGNGRVEVRWPKAAGDGRDGVVRLEGRGELPSQLSATSLTLTGPGPHHLQPTGLVTLRSQGRLVVRGRLERQVQSGPAALAPGEHPSDWWKRLRGLPPSALVPEFDFTSDQHLSVWLERAEQGGWPWTVLIAGGDLVIEGQLALDGPLLLVAGGHVYLQGQVIAGELVTSVPRVGSPAYGVARNLPIEIDGPSDNPLRVPLRFAVVSKPLRPGAGFERWLQAELSAHRGTGRIELAFEGWRPLPGGERQSVGPVEQPLLLEDADELSIRLDLYLLPGAPIWDPPWVDSLRVWYAERR
jgi:hypothetical protein